jgi:mRNA interferase RelE/StbE
MGYKVVCKTKILENLDNDIRKKVLRFFDRKELIINPRSFGEPLKYQLYGLWRYRVGQWQIIAKIQDNVLTILVIDIGKRDEIYK